MKNQILQDDQTYTGVLLTEYTIAKRVRFVNETDLWRFYRTMVGGFVTPVLDPESDVTFWVDDDGIPKGLDLNVIASVLCGQALYGPVFITGCSLDTEKPKSVPQDLVKMIGQMKLLSAMGIMPNLGDTDYWANAAGNPE